MTIETADEAPTASRGRGRPSRAAAGGTQTPHTESGRARSGSGYRQDTTRNFTWRAPMTGRTMSASQCSAISAPHGSRSVTASCMRHRSEWSKHARQPEAELASVHEHVQRGPERRRREASPFDNRPQLSPGKVDVDPAAEAAIRAGNDVLAADDRGIA